jgi:hypothetical protein
MAYEGKSPDFDWIPLTPKTAEPTFPATAGHAYKEGTLFYSNATGTAPTPKGIYVYTTDDGTATGTWGFQVLSPNNNATLINTGNLAPEYGGVPCGTILPFGKDVISTGLPTGYLMCDGSAIDQTSFATLYAVIGTAFEGDHTHTYKRMDTHNFGQSGTANPEFESDTQTSSPNGANVSTETRPTNIYVEYIIRYL